MKTFHIDEPREIGKKKLRVSPKELAMVKDDLTEIVVKKKLREIVKEEIQNLDELMASPMNSRVFRKGTLIMMKHAGEDRSVIEKELKKLFPAMKSKFRQQMADAISIEVKERGYLFGRMA